MPGARLVELDLEVAVRHGRDVLDHPVDVLAHHVERAAVGAGELPADALLCVGRGAKRGQEAQGDPGDRCAAEPIVPSHFA
jgi:hypothetical protein